MNYKQVKRQFREVQLHSTLGLLKWSRLVFHLIDMLNRLDGFILKLLVILLGFQYDIYIKLQEVSYDNSYLDTAEKIKNQIKEILPVLGE